MEPAPGGDVVVSASLLDATGAVLSYVLDFGSEVSLNMLDDGVGDDVSAGDGVFTGTIPGQPAGTLVRYRILVSGDTGETRYPRADDTVTYDGTVVVDPAVVTQLPVSELILPGLSKGDVARVRIDALGDQVFSGRIVRI